MFHKFRKPKIHVAANFVWPVRFIFVLVATYFAMEVYKIFQSGVASYKYGDDGIRGESDFRYWLKFTQELVFGLFFILLAVYTKENKSGE